MHCQQDTDDNTNHAAEIYRERLAQERLDEETARAMQEQWQGETDRERTARVREDE